MKQFQSTGYNAGSGSQKSRGCFECHEEGHFKRECPKFLAKMEKLKLAAAREAGN